MKVSREQMAENRERIVAVAARRFREHGFDGISVADVMSEAGLTHGGFYGHFANKEELMAEAVNRAVADTRTMWTQAREKKDGNPLGSLAHNYLSPRHRDRPGHGCAMAALAVDATRHGPQVREALTAGLRQQIDDMTGLMPQAETGEQRRQALASYAAMVGALMLSRAVDDPALSAEILSATEASISTAG